jgi:hypothetical protein
MQTLPMVPRSYNPALEHDTYGAEPLTLHPHRDRPGLPALPALPGDAGGRHEPFSCGGQYSDVPM